MLPASVQADFAQNNTYHHQASGRYYKAYQRDGKFYLRRHQINAQGNEVNVFEKEIHYVVGSGNHARSYLHRTPDHRLLQMPLTWYSAEGGFWAMSPGYDQPNHVGFRRVVDFECMACHNAYPEIQAGSDILERTPRFPSRIPSGIDCQRCHGPGRDHLRALAAGEPPKKVRQTIVNPARLSFDGQLEVCMQCHLETTSSRLPHSILRFGRGAFSYRPGEPLEDYVLHFDHAPGAGYDNKFEVVQSVYRLRKSRCFRESQGRMTCTTCHDPHHAPRGDEAVRHYSQVCRSCHTDIAANVQDGKHTSGSECLGCHMPKRRTEDAVHSVMTDHYIQRRRPDRDLLAPRKEVPESVAYRGEVALYYPPQLADTSETDLYLAVAQVKDGSNLEAGIARLNQAIEKHRPAEAGFYFELAEAYLKTRQFDEAIRLYKTAIELRPSYLLARRNLGLAFLLAGRLPQATETTRAVLNEAPREAEIWNTLGETYYPQQKLDEAIGAFEKAVALRPDLAEAHNNLGAAKLLQGNVAGAEQAFHEAVRIKPDFAAAQKNLAALPAKPSSAPTGDDLQQLIALAQAAERENRLDDAARLYKQILEKRPGWAAARLNLGLVYHSAVLYPEAIRALNEAIEQDASLASAYLFLGASYYHLDQYARAVELLEAYLAREPQSTEVRAFLAASYYGLKDYQNAALQYLQQIRLTPNDPELYFHLGECYAALAGSVVESLEADPAAAYFSLLASAEQQRDLLAAEVKVGEALATDSGEPEGHVAFGNLSMKQSRYGEAKRSYERALGFDSDHCRALQGLADAELVLGSYDASLDASKRAALLWPACMLNPVAPGLGLSEEEYQLRLSKLRELQASEEWASAAKFHVTRLEDNKPAAGNVSPAQACREAVARRDFASPSKGSVVMASCLGAVGDLGAATPTLLAALAHSAEQPELAYLGSKVYLQLTEQAYAKLKALAPRSPWLARLRAQAFEREGEIEKADAEYRRAIEWAESGTEALVSYAKFQCRVGRFADAMPVLRQVLAKTPNHPQASALLGEVYLSTGRSESAEPHLRRVLELNPSDAHSRANLANSLDQQQRLDEAIAVLEAAPADPDGSLHYLLGAYYRRMGDREKALEALRVYEQRQGSR